MHVPRSYFEVCFSDLVDVFNQSWLSILLKGQLYYQSGVFTEASLQFTCSLILPVCSLLCRNVCFLGAFLLLRKLNVLILSLRCALETRICFQFIKRECGSSDPSKLLKMCMCINCGVYLWEMRENTHKNTRKKTTIKSSFFLCIHHMTCLSSDMSCEGFNNVLDFICKPTRLVQINCCLCKYLPCQCLIFTDQVLSPCTSTVLNFFKDSL